MEIFVARQPILDHREVVFGYELLFRSGFDNFYTALNGDHATAMTLHNSFFTIGIETLTGGKRGFVNFTENLLLGDVATLFPKDLIGVEILETVNADNEIMAACRRLKEADYLVVLDDFVPSDSTIALLPWADIVKIDVLETEPEMSRSIIQEFGSPRKKFLAEKVEDQETYRQALELGFSLFQGYFFCKPKIVTGRDIPGYKLAYLKLLEKLSRPELDCADLERIFKHDMSLTYKLLRLMNSAFFGFHNEIRSTKHALALLGMQQAKKWLTVIALSGIGKHKCSELVLQSLIRANLCELIAPKIGLEERAPELFLMGLFSMVDAMLEQPISYFLDRMPVCEEIKLALLREGGSFQQVYELVLAYEKADWQNVSRLAGQLQFPQKDFPRLYVQSVERSNQFLMG
ncbi:HDOD domain-containing protein [bacterium]|nr:HDOD domain-containing protein [bacterium]